MADDNGAGRARPHTGGFTGRVPERPNLEGVEDRFIARWEAEGTYHFDDSAPRDRVYSIDTPPPTVSGSLHVGHVFSYTQTDIVARFHRMQGRAVFYPIGWDDNGLPTERRVQNHFGVRCDPSVAYDPSFVVPDSPPDRAIAISRPNFIALCRELTNVDEQAFEALFRRLGLSVDWRHTYTTIGERARRVSQLSFCHLVERGEAYRQEAPTLWDVDFRTAVAQAELEDREVPGAYNRLAFARVDSDGAAIEVETTRPELLAACVALVANPDDERFSASFGKTVRTPLFSAPVPVLPHRLAEQDKGTGIAMVCTFGDLTDVTWWRELGLPTRTVLDRTGRLEPVRFGTEPFASLDPERANSAYRELEGLTVHAARKRIVDLLRASGALIGEPRPVRHAVKFYERGDRPLEIVSSQQWYVRTMALRDELLELGRQLVWRPEFMRARYESWVEGLTGDWNISRQRFFGVPFPVWYRVDDDGTIDGAHPILAASDRLPIDPSTDAPDGYSPEQRGLPGGFVGDPDVMDTWATSSLTPEIAGGWSVDPELFAQVYPMDLRPQAHEIIRTWLFTSIVRARLEHHGLPWSHAAISGWILDPDRKKMSKSKGNVVVPTALLESHSTDAVRYWAGSARLGFDTVFDEQQMRIGRRLAIKILNAARFTLGPLTEPPKRDGAAYPLDASMAKALRTVVVDATAALGDYEHARALERTEQFFWTFCDDYLELVKARAYRDDEGGRSARAALVEALDIQLRLFAPFLPFVTDEVWSWFRDGSIHRAPWPDVIELDALAGQGDEALLFEASRVLGEVRRAKTNAKLSLRTEVRRAVVRAPEVTIVRLEGARDDLIEAGVITALELVVCEEELAVDVEL